MAQKISIEAAYEEYRGRAEALFHENVLLRAQVADMEKALAQFTAGQEQDMPQPTAAPLGPDLAAVPPYEAERG